MGSSRNAHTDIPIDSASHEVRILELLPGPEGSQLSGRLVRYSLDDRYARQPYGALSYMWGEATAAKSIRLNQNTALEITDNLEAALQVLRYQDRVRVIWVDAICINQADIQERNHQVQLMRLIYRNSETVHIWLDIDIDLASPAMAKLQTFDDQSTEEDLGTDALFWGPLSAVFKNQYWTRLWIQQEITNAASLTIHCRKALLPVINLYHYIRVFNHRVAAVDINTPSWVDWLDVSPNIRLPQRFGMIDSSHEPLQGSTLGGDLNLLEVLDSSFKFKCTDDRDRIYGILYLACDYSEGDIAINYEGSVGEAYTSVAQFVLRKYGSLNFLLYAGLNWKDPRKERSLPSWVPDWRNPSTRMWLSYQPKFLQIATPLMQKLRPWFSDNGTVLHIYGMHIDSIDEVFLFPEGVALYNTSAATFLEICRSVIRKALSNQPGSERDRHESDGFHLPQWQVLICALTGVDNLKPEDPDSHDKLKRGFSISADRFIETTRSSKAALGHRTLSFLDIIQMNGTPQSESGQVFARLVWGIIGKHHPFVGTHGGVGMAIQGAKPGDQVWVILGCDRPMVLRPIGEQFLVVGEGYYDGVNRGELLRDIPGDISEGDSYAGYRIESIGLQ
ncbi:MAG: hypothetical protein M1813_006989 [Trichoglossum hirsutum]|nr:MAG: hypothetical protein M1813_006989 [Trichoglossum hirsutum]